MLIDGLIVKPLFDGFTPTLFSDILFWIVAIYIVYLFITSKFFTKRHIEWHGVVIGVLVGLYFIIYRYKIFGFDHYNFISLKYSDWIKYYDIITFALVLLVSHKLLPFSVSEEIDDSKYSLIDDSHIKTPSSDELDRKQLAEYVSNYIHHSKSNDSMAIAINAKWGDGKTSFQKMISEYLKHKDKEAIIIEFNPWRSASEDKISKDFFELFADNIGNFDLRLGEKIISYSNKLMATTSSWWSFLSHNSKNQDRQFEHINNSLINIKRKVVVFVDDLDRLNFKEILEVVKLIRNSANFHNTFFIVGYDEEYISEALRHHNDYGKDNFLEKIFQIQFDLSQVDPNIIKRKLFDFLELKMPLQKIEIQSVIYPKISDQDAISTVFLGQTTPDQFIPGLLTNLRDVKRFANYLSLSINIVSTEVLFKEYFYLSLLRFRFPYLIRKMLKYQKRYLTENIKGYHHHEVKVDELKAAMEELKIDENDRHVILKVFETLYEVKSTAPERRSILYPDNFFIYYDNALNSKGVLYSEVVPLLDKSWSEIERQILSWVDKGNASNLINILRDIDQFSNRERFEKITKIWILLHNLNSDQDRNINLWLEQISKGKEEIEKMFGSDLTFFNSIFEPKKDSTFFFDTYPCRLILQKYIDNRNYYFPLSKSEIQTIAINRLRDFMSSRPAFDVRVFNAFYYNCWETKSEDSTIIMIAEANEILLNYIKNHQKDYLRFTIRSKYTPHLDNEYTFEPFTYQYFGSWDNFEKFLRKKASRDREFLKMVEYFESFKKNNYEMFYTEDSLPWIGADDMGNSTNLYFKDQTYNDFLSEMFNRYNKNQR